MNDKFILMGLDDERSKDIAEVLGNKTCKKILDFLAETKESSEKDISEGLKIPMNTAEYNLNKLIKSGLVEKTQNFFWSRKGKKIKIYKLARKHIIISPNKKFNINNLKAILPVLIAVFAIIALVLYFDWKEINNQNLDLKSDISAKNLPKEINASLNPGSKTSATAESVQISSAGEADTEKKVENLKLQLKDKALIVIEITLLLFIFILVFLALKHKK
ncbi:helix-turn-helix transcriptional regulator [Candidatus Pacearchaeota archaeon]|nr:helix-turn-helix transcriptional regulator [Candidatus Pacearchaeota archaeon]